MRTYWRKYTVNESFFDRIDSEEKAYTLGFIGADGYVREDGFGFTLHEKDRDVLEAIRSVMQSGHVIRPLKRNRVGLDITSRVLARRLMALGLRPAKTFSMEPPTDIPDDLLSHWLRGYWDGDGWLTTRKRAGGLSPVVGVAGWSERLMVYIQSLCAAFSGAKPALGSYKDGWIIRVEAGKARKWIEAVYLNGDFGMARKKQKAVELYALPAVSLEKSQAKRRAREYKERFEQRNVEIRQLRADGWRIVDIAVKFGICSSTVSMICSGRRR